MPVHQVTHLGLRVIKLFLDSPREKRHGYSIARAVGAPERNVYYTLETIENYGWLTSRHERQEDVDMRPARKLYEITPTGMSEARDILRPLQMAST